MKRTWMGPTVDDTPTLIVVGALSGAFAGGATAALILLVGDFSVAALSVAALVFGAEVGATLGAVLLPAALRLVIPDVLLGRAAVAMVVGVIVSAVPAFSLTRSGGNALGRAICAGLLGALLAIVVLRVRADAECDADLERWAERQAASAGYG